MEEKCYVCDEGILHLTVKARETFKFPKPFTRGKEFFHVTVFDFTVKRCDICNEEFVTKESIEKVEKALKNLKT